MRFESGLCFRASVESLSPIRPDSVVVAGLRLLLNFWTFQVRAELDAVKEASKARELLDRSPDLHNASSNGQSTVNVPCRREFHAVNRKLSQIVRFIDYDPGSRPDVFFTYGKPHMISIPFDDQAPELLLCMSAIQSGLSQRETTCFIIYPLPFIYQTIYHIPGWLVNR